MANILYGINGEGSGHWTRSREVILHLQKSGNHNVTVVTSGLALANLKDHFRVEEIFGFRFQFKNDKIDGLATFFKNSDSFPKGAKSLKRVRNLIKKEKIDIIVTDFEPISCLAGRTSDVPVVSIDNQHFISRTDADCPHGYLTQARVAKTVIETMTLGAEAYLTTSFFDAKTQNNSTFILPPIIRREIFYLEPKIGDYILVYITHGCKSISKVLKAIDFKFVVYGVDEESQDSNVIFRKFSQVQFLKDLAGSAGVLATAGFSLISEALFLGKPFLAWPVQNQFEQVFNAYHLERLGYGKLAFDLEVEKIESFLFNLKHYSQNLYLYSHQHGTNDKLFTNLDGLVERFIT